MSTALPLVLELPASSRLQGRVDIDGEPAEGALVTLDWARGMNEPRRAARTGSDGRFVFDELPAATVQVNASLGNLNAPLFQPSAADISPDGTMILVRDRSATAYLWTRQPGQSVWDALQGTALAVSLAVEAQGEAIGWAADGSGFYTTSEWDTAAGQCVLEQAGGAVQRMDGSTLKYNTKDSLLNPDFLACGDAAVDWAGLLRG